MKPIKYKNFNASYVELGAPVNKKSEIKYNGGSLQIQTPLVTINSTDSITFNLKKKGQLLSCFEELHTKLVEIIYLNSKEFFNGKIFKEDHMLNNLLH